MAQNNAPNTVAEMLRIGIMPLRIYKELVQLQKKTNK